MVLLTEDRRTGRARGDTGAALVEGAILSPLFFYLLFGIIEMGLYFQNYLTLGAATSDGARVASVAGDVLDADFQIIQVVKDTTGGIRRTTVKKLVVFRAASGPASTVPDVCKNMTTAGQDTTSHCNTYTPQSDWDVTDSRKYACSDAVAPYEPRAQGYCPSDRKTALAGDKGPPDYLGIYIEFQHVYITGLFGSSKTISDTVITRLEPQSAQ